MIYILIHIKLVNQICQKLEIQFIWLAKEKLIREYDEKLTKKIITHKILLNLTVESHKKLTVSMIYDWYRSLWCHIRKALNE